MTNKTFADIVPNLLNGEKAARAHWGGAYIAMRSTTTQEQEPHGTDEIHVFYPSNVDKTYEPFMPDRDDMAADDWSLS